MTYEEVYFKVMGHSPNKEHGVQGAFTWSDIESLMQEAVKNNAVLPHVSGSLPDKFKDIIRFIESDLMEVKLYGNDGFDNQEELDGKEYLARLIKDAVGNDR